MERKEFEQVLKRALELQSLQKATPADESFSPEDLQSAAARLGISEEILEQALRDTKRQYKKYHFSDSPEQVREAFLKHFLMNESILNPGQACLKIDHASIKPGGSTIRVFHPAAANVDACIDFSPAADGGTNVTWSGNNQLSLRTRALIFSWPLIILIPLYFNAASQGSNILDLLPLIAIFFFTSAMMQWGAQLGAGRLEKSLESYFQNCQTLDEIENSKKLKVELNQLRSQNAETLNEAQKRLMKTPVDGLHDNSDGGEDVSAQPIPADKERL